MEKKQDLKSSLKHLDLTDKCWPAYLADGTNAFAFSTHAFAGIGAQLPVFAVGALAAIHSVVTADTLTAGDPLRGRRGKVNASVSHTFQKHTRSGLESEERK